MFNVQNWIFLNLRKIKNIKNCAGKAVSLNVIGMINNGDTSFSNKGTMAQMVEGMDSGLRVTHSKPAWVRWWDMPLNSCVTARIYMWQ